MIDGELFEKVEHIARTIKEDERPFGGIQLVLCGYVLTVCPILMQLVVFPLLKLFQYHR